MIRTGLPLHELHRPSTEVLVLGWKINTIKMTAACPAERWEWIQWVLTQSTDKINLRFIQSVLEYLAPFLRAPLGWFHRTVAEIEKSDGKCTDNMKYRFLSNTAATLKGWDGTASLFRSPQQNLNLTSRQMLVGESVSEP